MSHKPLQVLFLDIDGTLNDHTRMSNQYCGIKRTCVDNLNRILDTLPDLKIVISSAWRYMILREIMTIKGFEMLLLTHGIKCFDKVIGYTEADGPLEDEPHHHNEPHKWSEMAIRGRGTQITNWVTQNNVDTFIALDDLHINIPEHYLVNSDTGLTDEDADNIISRLRSNILQKAAEITGYVKCEFEPSYDACEACQTTFKQLYFGDRDYWDPREGRYLCAECVVELRQRMEYENERARNFYPGLDRESEETSEGLDTNTDCRDS